MCCSAAGSQHFVGEEKIDMISTPSDMRRENDMISMPSVGENDIRSGMLWQLAAEGWTRVTEATFPHRRAPTIHAIPAPDPCNPVILKTKTLMLMTNRSVL